MKSRARGFLAMGDGIGAMVKMKVRQELLLSGKRKWPWLELEHALGVLLHQRSYR